MPECKVCEKGVAEFVDDELDKGIFLDDISAKLAQLDPPIFIHRSSIHRHKARHYLPRLRLRMAEKKAHGPQRRILVEWPDNPAAFGALAGKITDDGNVIPPNQVRREDAIITISFETLPARNSPAAQKPEAPKEESPTTSTL
jgi:hypothetical protein